MTDQGRGLLDLFVCPACRSPLTWDYEAAELVCSGPACGLAYPVREGIPMLVVDEARATSEGLG
ncbi:MAG: Trm112 family protein [Propioniciclava sp.]